MQSPRVYDPNEVVTLALPARMLNLVLEVFHKLPNLGLPYDVVHELLSEIHTQCEAVPQEPRDDRVRNLRESADG